VNKPRIVLADDHQILAEGLRRMLEPEFEVVATVSNGIEMIAAAELQSPDVIIADISMPMMNGIDAMVQIREKGFKAKVIFLTMHRDVAYTRRAMEAGANGYLLKHSASSELTGAIREVLQGRTYVTPMIAGELLESYREADPATSKRTKRLTTRQREVLQLVAEGRSAKEVSRALNISVRTAEAHKAKILETLELSNTTELVQYAIRKGMISAE
jgi:DNA-binding NarL/FixJ family response regulator